MLRVLVAVVDDSMVGHGLVVLRGGGVPSVGGGRGVASIGRSRGVSTIGGGVVLAQSQGHQGEEEQLGVTRGYRLTTITQCTILKPPQYRVWPTKIIYLRQDEELRRCGAALKEVK